MSAEMVGPLGTSDTNWIEYTEKVLDDRAPHSFPSLVLSLSCLLENVHV
jgi:hypothetical protein